METMINFTNIISRLLYLLGALRLYDYGMVLYYNYGTQHAVVVVV